MLACDACERLDLRQLLRPRSSRCGKPLWQARAACAAWKLRFVAEWTIVDAKHIASEEQAVPPLSGVLRQVCPPQQAGKCRYSRRHRQRRVEDRRPETAAKKPKPRIYGSFSQTGKSTLEGARFPLLKGRRKEGAPRQIGFVLQKAHTYVRKQYIVKKGLALAAKIT